MSLILPFKGLRPKPDFAEDVIAPPYDVLNSEEARARAANRPMSFLHISKPEIDLPPDTNPYDQRVYDKGAQNLNRLVADGVLLRDPDAMYYLYRLRMGEHEQTGLVAVASVADYDSNRIKKHEFTRPEKENDRVKQIDALNAQTGPVFLTYRQDATIEKISNEIKKTPPVYDLSADDGVQHTLWTISDQSSIDLITATFDAMDCLYIADGHHRSAAASRVAALHSANQTKPNAGYFLSVIFPDTQMKILDYNRVIKDLNGLAVEEFLAKLNTAFSVTSSKTAVKPGKPCEFGMYLDGNWYRLTLKPERYPAQDPVARLDVSLLQDNLIAPILAVKDPRSDKRIDFVGGIRGLAELEKRVDSGEMQLAFSLYPTRMEDLMSVADANEVMPPKSTWFEPKLADGLVSHVLD